MCILDPKAMSNISYSNQNFTHPFFCFFLVWGGGGGREAVHSAYLACFCDLLSFNVYTSFFLVLTPLHSERPKLYTILACLSAIGLRYIDHE